MLNGTPAGAEVSPAPASLSLRKPVFGDWVTCGDIEKTLLIADKFAPEESNATVDTRHDPEAVAAWLRLLSKVEMAQILALPLAEGKLLFKELKKLVPSFADAKAGGGQITGAGVLVPLKSPLPQARGQVQELLLRRPTVGDWITCGDASVQRVAVQQDDDTAALRQIEMRIDRAAVNRWLMALTGQPEALLALLDYEDARNVYAHLRGMLAGLDVGN